MAISIREDNNIAGIIVRNTCYKISLMADDTTLFIANIESLIQAVNKFRQFEMFSGLKLNITKIELINSNWYISY